MNKVVTINLNGFLFTIDEQAYEILKDYLHSLANHFSKTEGGNEIVNDIETRIAELLQANLSNHNQVVQEVDVKKVIAMMGEPWQLDDDNKSEKSGQTENQKTDYKNTKQAKLRRDTTHKVIGGVCAGAGNYLQIDPVILRLLFAVAFFIFGSGLLLYIILWIALPASNGTDGSDSTYNRRRLFRDHDDKTIGGVCGGLGYYFGIDPVWFRILFLVAFFVFGTGLMLYLILWLVLPKAVTSADKLRMKGETIDINNIEREFRSTFARPDNAFNRAGNLLSDVFKNIVILAGKIFGFIFATIGICLLIGWISILTNQHELAELNGLLGLAVSESIISTAQIGALLMSGALSAIFLMLGIRLLFGLNFKTRGLYLLATSAFFIGMIIQGVAITRTVMQFQKTATRSFVNDYANCPDTLYLQAISLEADGSDQSKWSIYLKDRKLLLFPDEVNPRAGLFFNEIFVTPAVDHTLHTGVFKTARAVTREDAMKAAEAIDFGMTFKDSMLTVNHGIFIDKNYPFQFQNVKMNLKVPPGTIIIADDESAEMINNHHQNDFDASTRIYQMTKHGLISIDQNSFKENTSEDDEDLMNMDIETDKNGEEKVSIRVNKQEKGIRIKKEKNGKVTKTTQKIGPITIETSETEEEK